MASSSIEETNRVVRMSLGGGDKVAELASTVSLSDPIDVCPLASLIQTHILDDSRNGVDDRFNCCQDMGMSRESPSGKTGSWFFNLRPRSLQEYLGRWCTT